jgi:hypothetical protein
MSEGRKLVFTHAEVNSNQGVLTNESEISNPDFGQEAKNYISSRGSASW